MNGTLNEIVQIFVNATYAFLNTWQPSHTHSHPVPYSHFPNSNLIGSSLSHHATAEGRPSLNYSCRLDQAVDGLFHLLSRTYSGH